MNSIVYNLDCLPELKKYQSNFFDLAIVDPPYGINAPKQNYNNGMKKGRLNSAGGKLKDRLLNSSLFDWDDKKPSKEYFEELFRVSKNCIIFGANYFELPSSRCWICWDKMQPFENFSKIELAYTSFDFPSKIYRIRNTGGPNIEKRIHPTQKPVKLYDCIIKDFCKPDQFILDTHVGSGSSRIAADKAGLNYTGFEISKEYYEQQEKRFKNYKKQLKLNI